MKTNNNLSGHLFAIITVLMWGNTFISTKILLLSFTTIEILFFRFTIGLVTLGLAFPKRLKFKNLKEELFFAGAGLCGVTLYFLLENIALTYTLASNVGIIVSIAPFFTAILSQFFLENERLKPCFFIGFSLSMFGIILINLNGINVLKLNPTGDFLAFTATIIWAFYCILTKKISEFGYHTVQTTRKIFLYGIIFMLPALFFLPFEFNLQRFGNLLNLFNIIFLGMGASAMGFVTWNTAIKLIGTVKTSVYIYAIPSITIITSIIVLKEDVNLIMIMGAALTLTGLVISEGRINLKINSKP